MCGFCGVIGGGPAPDRRAMLDILAHRGPDGEGEFDTAGQVGRVWFGHRRLAIIDLSPTGTQPMSLATPQGTLTLVFNGEIYNYAALRRELIARGHHFVSTSDTEVLLAGWREWGEGVLERIEGMFAFALWDARHETLWLVRDRMGEKPLYYHIDGDRIVFGSEIRSLLASGLVPRVLDRDGLEAYLAFGSVSQPYTLIKGVRMLGAGQALCYHDHTVAITDYWAGARSNPAEVLSRDDAVSQVRRVLDDALHRCMVADVPVALLLSGGVDSTAILARLSALGYGNLSTFSVGFSGEDAGLSESEWALRAAKRFGSRHHQFDLTSEDARDLIPTALAGVDQPSFDGFNHYLVFQAIARAGFKVALTGQGADELFYGYARHRSFNVSRLAAKFRAPALVRQNASAALGALAPQQHRLSKAVTLFAPGSSNALAYASRHAIFTAEQVGRILGRRISNPVRFIPEPQGDTPIAQLYDMETRHFMRSQLLRDGDQMSMAVSLELRAPFVDRHLVELVTPMPTGLKLVPGRQKALLVDAVDDPLVEEISRRPKAGFPFPLRRWVEEELGQISPSLDVLGFDPAITRELESSGSRGLAHPQYWILMVLASWMHANQVVAHA